MGRGRISAKEKEALAAEKAMSATAASSAAPMDDFLQGDGSGEALPPVDDAEKVGEPLMPPLAEQPAPQAKQLSKVKPKGRAKPPTRYAKFGGR